MARRFVIRVRSAEGGDDPGPDGATVIDRGRRWLLTRLSGSANPTPGSASSFAYPVCACGHRYDHHNGHMPGVGCYRCACSKYCLRDQ